MKNQVNSFNEREKNRIKTWSNNNRKTTSKRGYYMNKIYFQIQKDDRHKIVRKKKEKKERDCFYFLH